MLPLTLAPPAPFPLIAAQSSSRAYVAPGLSLVTYYLETSSGPLVIRVLAIDPREPTLRFAAVLARDALRSGGETVSSMARRTGAVAGINADYFDIGQTNQPLNIVVQGGTLLRTPSGRATVSFMRDRSVRFGTYRFTGSASDGERAWQIGGLDEWPPQGAGAMLMQRAFGTPPPAPGVTFVHIEPIAPANANVNGAFRVLSVERDASTCAGCLTLALGVRAESVGPLPAPGDVVHVQTATNPPLEEVTTAVGGGPLLVRDGAPFADPDPPSPAEALQHDPQAGMLRARDGALAFAAVDGRSKGSSVGLTRPEFGALLIALGATDGIAFDSGGSATLVARAPGDAQASVQNVPSDGHERKVADGIFVYDDAPPGPAARLAVRPSPVSLLVGAGAAITAFPTDWAGRPVQVAPTTSVHFFLEPASLGRVLPGGVVLATRPGTGILHVRRGTLEADAPVHFVSSLRQARIEPPDPNPAPGGTVAFRAFGSDLSGAPVLLGEAVRWTSSAGRISADGRFTAESSDAEVVASVAGHRIATLVRVGRSEARFDAFSPRTLWRFATLPAGGPGSVATEPDDGGALLELAYDFSAGTRAAYANANAALPGQPLALSLDVRGEGSGAGLRVAFDNADGDRIAVTLARRIDWRGWRRCSVALPANAVAPLRLRSLYLLSALGGAPSRAVGTVAFRDMDFTFAGSARPTS